MFYLDFARLALFKGPALFFAFLCPGLPCCSPVLLVCEVDEGPCLIFMEQERNLQVFWRDLRFALFVPKDGKM